MGSVHMIRLLIVLLTLVRCNGNFEPVCKFYRIKTIYKPVGCYHFSFYSKELLSKDVVQYEATDLTFYNSTIGKIPALAFHDFSNLKLLNLSNSDITEIELGAFLGLTQLKNLHLEKNPRLTIINRGSFKGLGNLDTIYLNENNFNVLPNDTFSDLPNVTLIDLSQNKLSSVDDSIFSGLAKLSSLNLSSNHLKLLPFGMFKDLKKLVKLDLSHNLLTNIPVGLVSGLEALQLFTISHNQLIRIEPTSLYSSVGLIQLDVSYNRLSNLDAIEFSTLSRNLSRVNLDNNQWKCDVLSNIIKTFRINKVYVVPGSAFLINNVHGIHCTTSSPNETTISNSNKYSSINVLLEIVEKMSINNNLMDEMNAAYKNHTEILQNLLELEHVKSISTSQCNANWISHANLYLMVIIVIVLSVLCFTYVRNRRHTYISDTLNPINSSLLYNKADEEPV
ncbi:carboxypeptidase N subunit 2-like [Agrilus planipennis]|uniref:Carboxypeptidase N subunit 2-like n=1 Tax=Agrilus planipennis TaxID=224129 RepID=A0A7F5RKP3_AGRPL|nr:carboxypeptidase N subunit 2-like [Agrilus planipennis]